MYHLLYTAAKNKYRLVHTKDDEDTIIAWTQTLPLSELFTAELRPRGDVHYRSLHEFQTQTRYDHHSAYITLYKAKELHLPTLRAERPELFI